MALRINGESWTGSPRALRLEQYKDGRLILWIRTPEEEAADPRGQGPAQQHIMFKPGDLPHELERALLRALQDR